MLKTVSTPEERKQILISARLATGLNAAVFGRLMFNGKVDGDAILYKKELASDLPSAKGVTYVDVMCAELLRFLFQSGFDIQTIGFSSIGRIISYGQSSLSTVYKTKSTPRQRREILINAHRTTRLSPSLFGKLLNNGKSDGGTILYKKELEEYYDSHKGTTYVDVMCAELLRLLFELNFDLETMKISPKGQIDGINLIESKS